MVLWLYNLMDVTLKKQKLSLISEFVSTFRTLIRNRLNREEGEKEKEKEEYHGE